MKQLRAVIMCGGKSLRMGTDKGLIPIQNTCWAGYMAGMVPAPLPVSVSINTSQLEGYSSVFDTDQLITDSLDVGGPLNGLLSVHIKYPDDDLFLLGCDMIEMQDITLTRLIDTHTNEPGYAFYAYHNGGFAETLCSIYTANALKSIFNNIADLPGLSLQKMLIKGNTLFLPVTEPVSFQNFNTLP
jgi:molybdopterin-guanine dinucleotide biosynthesis protein A